MARPIDELWQKVLDAIPGLDWKKASVGIEAEYMGFTLSVAPGIVCYGPVAAADDMRRRISEAATNAWAASVMKANS